MAYDFLDMLTTPGVMAAQAANSSREMWAHRLHDRRSERFTPDEAAFIAERDSFYLASIGEGGWPYIQHRGGPPGFLKMLDERTLGFADLRGNRQYISVGNLATNDRVALFLMDYRRRARLKILARAELRDLAADPELAEKLLLPGYRARPERGMVLHLAAFDWNCPAHITPRYTEAEVLAAIAPMQARLAELEAENAALKAGAATPA
jgi:predicted pyridoxine 5'-phosphate oxidase superfamily flavin-nucleotide-binding protein